ncbi:hypothetical protein EWM62_17815 [Mucilaginibacter terrigena]|uniref:Uncharacterized protein YyaB-like PH domain-containing protein n=1 Tax=Mucilaginibacter terrigena TaxID=2492395 RepID=A0A4Q5LHA8_9SPHI|nr:PH domain-containing protein [Mucilaginibacter terrigena]RYU86512.1 hypothetical protein EWM62_17815 [Mucilaginibacter terrigena]
MITGDKVYPSKKGFIVYILLGLLTIMEVSYFFNGLYLPALLCLGLTGVVIFPIVFNTCYTINASDILKVKCGFFVNQSIPVKNITRIVETNTILSAPALSFDRLEVFYGKYDSVVISPVNEKDFITQLKNINPSIEFVPKAA